jgi:hypothetical protein
MMRHWLASQPQLSAIEKPGRQLFAITPNILRCHAAAIGELISSRRDVAAYAACPMLIARARCHLFAVESAVSPFSSAVFRYSRRHFAFAAFFFISFLLHFFRYFGFQAFFFAFQLMLPACWQMPATVAMTPRRCRFSYFFAFHYACPLFADDIDALACSPSFFTPTLSPDAIFGFTPFLRYAASAFFASAFASRQPIDSSMNIFRLAAIFAADIAFAGEAFFTAAYLLAITDIFAIAIELAFAIG